MNSAFGLTNEHGIVDTVNFLLHLYLLLRPWISMYRIKRVCAGLKQQARKDPERMASQDCRPRHARQLQQPY